MGKLENHKGNAQPTSAQDRHEFMAIILGRPLLRVFTDYHDEIRAKDQAYRFIVKQGLLDQFREFCSKEIPIR